MRALHIGLSDCGPVTAATASGVSGTNLDCLDLHFGNERIGFYGVPNAAAVANAINAALAEGRADTRRDAA